MGNRPLEILLIDDDELFTASLSDFLTQKGFRVLSARDGEQGITSFRARQPGLVLLDQELPDMKGIQVCERLLEIDPDAKIIFITAYATVRYAVEAMKAGAFHYLSKPFQLDELLIALDMAIRNLQLEGRLKAQDYQREKESQTHQLIGSSQVMRRIREQVKLAASSEANVLITGETGVGKNVVARAIYEYQRDRDPFLSVNCSAIPENLMEAEYFGHEKGVFTGAVQRREGIFELADRGTLVLDEIGEIPIHLQSKLLSVLEEKSIRRIGGGRAIPVDVRIIATTNQNLEKAIEEGQFRQDLYYRLAVVHIHVPPLREHPEDIPELAAHFMARFCRRTVKIARGHVEKLAAYAWPGNVRELRNVIERASLLVQGDEMRPGDLLFQGIGRGMPVLRKSGIGEILPLEAVIKEHILSALKTCSGNKTMAAKRLGISLSTLKRKLKQIHPVV